METLYRTPYISICLHSGPSHNTVEIQWHDFVPSVELRSSMHEMLRLAQLHQATAWIADNRLIRAMRAADLAWAGPNVLVPMSELGVRRFATVEAKDAMNRMGVTALFNDVIPQTQMHQRYFTTIEEARAWALAEFA